MDNETPGLSNRQTNTPGPAKQIINFLSSMQLGIILLLSLAVISVFATTREYESALNSVYRSWWFIAIMAFTALNLLLCSVRRAGLLYRQAIHPKRVQPPETIRKMAVFREIALKGESASSGKAAENTADAFGSAGLQVVQENSPHGTVIFGQRGRMGYFGSVATHFGLLLILLGAMYGALTGFDYRNGGIAGDQFVVPEGDFAVSITDVRMEMEEDPTVRPRVYSDVTVTKDNREVTKGTVAINEPLRFQGNTIYHTTFRYVCDVEIRHTATGNERRQKLLDHDELYLDHGGDHIHFLVFFPNFTMDSEGMPYSKNYLPERPVLAGILYNKNEQPQSNVFLSLDVPYVVETDNGEIELTMKGFENAAVYTITRNLGRPFLFTGAVLLIFGLYMSFFIHPRRFWAVYDEKNEVMLIGGKSYRNRPGIEQDLERIVQKMTSGEGE